MLLFQDFFLEIVRQGFFSIEFEPLRAALRRANEWIDETGADVVNVETVVLPNIHDYNEEGTQDTALRASGETYSEWHQFIRVWYRHDTP